jgi:hypothetical protein
MRTHGSKGLAALAVALAGFGLVHMIPVTAASPAPAPAIQALPSPAGANSSEPQVTMQGNRLILSWVETNGDHATLKFAERTATGWSMPKTAAAGDDFFINSADVPSVRALENGTLVAQWLQRNSTDPDSDAYNVRLSWSKDQGRTWSRPASPHHDGTKTQHGFVSLFPATTGGFGLVWLDGRATNPETETGNMQLRSAIYDGDGKETSETVVSPRVCDCCATSAVETPDGVIVAFRNRSGNEIRDIYVTRFADGRWSTPMAVHDDGWRIEACPINGPSISARGREVAVAWYTAKNDQGRAFVAFSQDSGRTFGQAIRIDDVASQGRVGVQLLEDGMAAVTWVEFANQQSQFRFRTVTPSGMRSAALTVAPAEGGGFPRIAKGQGELLFAWTEGENGPSRVKVARVSTGSK